MQPRKDKKTCSISLDRIVDNLTPARREASLSMAGITLMNNLVTKLSELWIITVGQPFKRPKNSLSNLFKNLTIVWMYRLPVTLVKKMFKFQLADFSNKYSRIQSRTPIVHFDLHGVLLPISKIIYNFISLLP